jgi:hypothetical protein
MAAFLLFPNPIFRSGEVCRHSKFVTARASRWRHSNEDPDSLIFGLNRPVDGGARQVVNGVVGSSRCAGSFDSNSPAGGETTNRSVRQLGAPTLDRNAGTEARLHAVGLEPFFITALIGWPLNRTGGDLDAEEFLPRVIKACLPCPKLLHLRLALSRSSFLLWWRKGWPPNYRAAAAMAARTPTSHLPPSNLVCEIGFVWSNIRLIRT